MNTNRHTTARTPGHYGGQAPKDYGTGRVCVCGTKILRYRKGDLCSLCERDPDRRARFANQEEDGMEPETMKTKEVGVYLGIQQHTVKKVMKDAGIQPVRRGGPGISATWPADEVRAFKAKRDEASRRTDDVGSGSGNEDGDEPSREEAAARVVQDAHDRNGHPRPVEDDDYVLVPNDEPESTEPEDPGTCYSSDDTCCGKPGDCELSPERNQAETHEQHVQRKLEEFARVLGLHLSFAGAAGQAALAYRESIEAARANGSRAWDLEQELRELGVEVQAPNLAPFPFLVELEVKRHHDDPEINALYVIAEALEPLDRAAQLRVLQWVTDKLALNRPAPASDPFE